MITIAWTISNKCNYKCPYCASWKDNLSTERPFDLAFWQTFWEKFNAKYGAATIHVSGGEPTILPHFFETAETLLSRGNTLLLCTSLQFEPEKILKFNPEKLKISPTFHSTQTDIETFLNKAVRLKKYLSDNAVICVITEKNASDLPKLKKLFNDNGINFIAQPLRHSTGETYEIENLAASNGELSAIEAANAGLNNNYRLGKLSPKGKLCRAGKDYAVIWPDGSIARCSRYKDNFLGNVENFKLYDNPAPCAKNFCPIEFTYIID